MELSESNIKPKSKIVGTIATLFVALTILSVSVLKSATENHAYNPTVLSERTTSEKLQESKTPTIDYLLAYQGKINPDSTLWYLKVLRDKVWYTFTFDSVKKSELNLLFADKRLNSSLEMFKNNKPDLGFATLTKAEKYLEMAVPKSTEDKEYLKKLALSSLKHREVIELQILPLSPEDVRPNVIRVGDYSKETYKKARDLMLSIGLVPPLNPFESK